MDPDFRQNAIAVSAVLIAVMRNDELKSDANYQSNVFDSESNIPVYCLYGKSSIRNYEMTSWIITATFVNG